MKSHPITAQIVSKNMKSAALVPLFSEGRYQGAVGFESKKKILFIKRHAEFIEYIVNHLLRTVSKNIINNNLYQSEKKYKSLFSYMSAAFTNSELIYDENGNAVDYRFLEVNSKFEEMTNIDAKSWLSHTAKELLPNLEGDLIPRAVEVIKTGKPVEYENYSVPFGKLFQFFIFKSGENTFATLSYDITERKKTEEALVESEKKYRNLFESMQAGFASHEMIYDKNHNPIDYRFIEINKKFEEITGIKKEDWIGKTVREVLPDIEQHWIDNYGDVVATGEPLEISNYTEALKKYYNVVAFKTGEDGFATLATDITNLKNMEHRLYEETERLKITLESIGEGVIVTDTEGKVIMLNDISEELTGWDRKGALGKDVSKIFDIYDVLTGNPEKNPVLDILKTGDASKNTQYIRLKSIKQKKEYFVSLSAAPIKDEDGNIFGAILVFRDVTEDKKRMDEIQYLSMHDALTGIYNRLYFENKLFEYDQKRDYPFSVIMGDANGLKITNDIFGHSEGDRLLRQIGKILVDCTGPLDIVARWGGDEFVVLLVNADSKTAEEVCDRITAACREYEQNLDGYSSYPSISLGCATRTKKDRNIMKVIKQAEDLMYKRKLLESKSAHSAIIASMKNTLYEKSHETEEHAERLSKYCRMLAKEMGLPSHVIYDIELFALLHDIGKVAIDGSILTKKDELTKSEWEELKRHPEIGYRIANSAPELAQVSEYILTHHERWDGKGYPQQLKGEEIPVQSRILAIIDSFDAMTHDRPYREALSISEAIDEIAKNSGTQFDSEIVKIFMEKIVTIYEV